MLTVNIAMEAPGYGYVLFPLLKLKTDGCLHRSQDRHGIYIVIFEYRDDYILLEDTSAPEAYMIMHEFGPWDTSKLNYMKSLAIILVEISLRAGSDSATEEKKSQNCRS